MRLKRWFYTVPLRIRSLFKRNAVEQELDEEMRYHLERQIEENLRRGMSAQEAKYAALRAMGGIEQRKEECRDARRWNFIENLLQDLRYARRVLRRNPGFTAVAVITLAVGIGGISAIFSVVNGVILRPLPYTHADRLISIAEVRGATVSGRPFVAPPKGEDWPDRPETRALLESVAWFEWWQFAAPERTESPLVTGARVPPNYFSTLGSAPQLGRDFRPEDAQGAQPTVAIVSYPFWQQSLGGDPNIVGKPLTFNTGSLTVIGVMPQAFRSPFLNEAQLWVPMPQEAGPGTLTVARMRPGVTAEEAESKIDALIKKVEQDYPGSAANRSARIEQLVPVDRFNRSLLLLLFGSVGFILLMAIINVANLMLSRAVSRGREMAIRSAMGAGSRRLMRQLLTESLLLAIPAGILGIVGAHLLVSAIIAGLPATFPRIHEINVDWAVLVFAFITTALTAVAFGIFPAFASARPDVQDTLKAGSRSASENRHSRYLRQTLVAVEIGLAVMLLIGAALTGTSFWNLILEPRGMDTENVVVARFLMRPRPEAVRSAFYSDLLERIRRYPEVESASIASRAPLIGGFLRPPFRIEGRAASNQESAAITAVGSSYFSTLNIGFVAGQPFKDNEQAAVINETMARKFWPNADPVGSRIKSGPSSGPWLTIVGVVRDEKLHPGVKGMPQVYEPCRLCTALLIKTRDAATDIPGVIRREIAALDATTLVTSIQTVDEQISRLDTVVGYRFRMALFLAFAGAGLLLAFAGVYGVTSYSAAQRTHEVGIRMALGATRRNVLGMIIRQSMVPALTGITAGVAGAAGLSRLLESYLFEIAPTDTTVFIAAVIFIAFVAMAANFIPARRSTHVDPLVALKYE